MSRINETILSTSVSGISLGEVVASEVVVCH